MRYLEFATKEIFRRKRGTTAGIMCVMLGISIFVGARTTNEALYAKTREQLLRFGANIIVQPKGEPFDIYSGTVGTAVPIPESYDKHIRSIEHGEMLVAVSPKLYERFTVADQSLMVAGISLEERKAKPWWLIDHELVESQFPAFREILLGQHAATRLGSPSTIDLNGMRFEVTGILDETGSPDDFMGFVPLAALQEVTRKQGMVNLFEISTSCIACKAMDVNKIAADITKVLPGDAQALPVRQIAEAQMATLAKVEQFSRIIYVLVLLLGALLLMNHMSASVAHQKRDIGMLMAMGMEPSTVHWIIVSKGLLLSVLGGLAGYFVGTGIAMVLGPRIAETQVSPIGSLLPYSVGVAFLIGAVSSLLPARKACSLDPVVALQEI